MASIRSVAVFCGSASGDDPMYELAARETGQWLAEHDVEVVYGGGRVGLMGAVADAALTAGGRVTGVMPQALFDREIGHPDLTALHVVESMHERKAMMADLADAFVALPGGAGTLEEITEQWTWAQLGVHGKPCGFLDVGGFWRPLFQMIERMSATGFTQPGLVGMLQVAESIEDLVAKFEAYVPPQPKWRTPPPPPPAVPV